MAKKRSQEKTPTEIGPEEPCRMIPLERAKAELTVVNSRFIATIEPVRTSEAARAFISEMKEKYVGATHNVPAYLIGHGNSTMAYCSDDGEPSGSSGRPLLTVLQGSGLGDAAIVVTRYFGGTKLGIGGLVRAYGDAGKAVLERTKRGELKSATVFSLDLPYGLYDRYLLLAADYRIQSLGEAFSDRVQLRGRILTQLFSAFENAVVNLTNGAVRPAHTATEPDAVFPIE